jgi:hypothetical protein
MNATLHNLLTQFQGRLLALSNRLRPYAEEGLSAVSRYRRTSISSAVVAAVALVIIIRSFTGARAVSHARASLAIAAPPREIADAIDPNPRASKAAAAMREWNSMPITSLSRNLFAVNLDYFPQESGRADLTLRLPQGHGFWDELEKSMLSKAEEKNVRQKLVEGLRLQAAQLHLQTIMMGPKPKAMIDGALVSEGDAIASFRVVKIAARGIILEREGTKLEISFR